jgi:hypothetical protein
MLAEFTGPWDTQRWIVFLSPFALILLAGLAALLLRKTFCTRFRMARQFHDDPDIKDWLIVYNWSRKIFYVPTIIASVIACILMKFLWDPAAANSPKVLEETEILGGIWLGIFFLNYLVDEYEINLKVILIFVLFVAVLMAWLTLMHWHVEFFRLFKHLGVQLNATAYLLLAIIFALGIVTSWIHGLFYYVAITPNYMNIQSGPTETGEQVRSDSYSTRIDTGDFLERILGFGRIIITFADHQRPPLVILVSRIGKKAAVLESLRGVTAVDLAPGKRGEDGGT